MKSYITIYREKTNEIHTQEAILRAFDESFAICFSFAKDTTKTKRAILGEIWRDNLPYVVI